MIASSTSSEPSNPATIVPALFKLKASVVTANGPAMNRASSELAISARQHCQYPPMQGSSEAMNVHSQIMISPLRSLFRVRK
jgi:hypothetical protein